MLRALAIATLCGALLVAVASGAPARPAQSDAQQCQAFAASDDPQAQLDGVRGRLLPLLGSLPAARRLFDAYLTPGTASAARRQVTDAAARAQFRRAPATVTAEALVFGALRAKLAAGPRPPLRAPAHPAGATLASRGLGTGLDVAYPLGFDTPGLIAGGTGSVESAAGTFQDARSISGRYELRPAATRRGVLKRVRLVLPHPRLEVLDSIDFCPGSLGGSAGTALGTRTMSRLERTPHPGGGTYAAPVLWRLITPLDPLDVSVTDLYRGNDADHDGVPGRQPWRGAHFRLDRCPHAAGRCRRG
jgi:hypothetical protein